jgi:hypothetical protein
VDLLPICRICALSPASSNHEETLSTLRYADRAKKIKHLGENLVWGLRLVAIQSIPFWMFGF